jgi:hypothetical protein
MISRPFPSLSAVDVEMSLTSPIDKFECKDKEHERIGRKVQSAIDNFDTSKIKIDDSMNFATSICNMPVENATHTTTTGRMLRTVSYTYTGGAICRWCGRDNSDLRFSGPELELSKLIFPSSSPSLSPWTVAVQSIETRLAEDIDKVLEDSSAIACLNGASLAVSVVLTPLNRPESDIMCSGDPSQPSKYPTMSPTQSPTMLPTKAPTEVSTEEPVPLTEAQSMSPTKYPTKPPTKSPTNYPTQPPTKYPTKPPTKATVRGRPTKYPTKPPTKSLTQPLALHGV